jgi:hypothetical protein
LLESDDIQTPPFPDVSVITFVVLVIKILPYL